MNKVRTRFAPSPTGNLHIGGLRTALYAYALAKHEGGDFLLRIEDTDKKREVAGGKEKIKEILKIFNLSWDEDYVQSELAKDGRYKKAAEQLVKDNHAYEDEGAIRIKIPRGEKISFHDFVLDKDVSWETDILEDLVILKSDGLPTYHLASVVDDHEMKISHVLRGHDWLPSTPIHLLLYKFLGYEVPEIGHLTDILDPEGGKLSKRKGSTSCEGLLKEGYLPEAILNFIMLLGWAPKDNQEIFSLEEFVKVFDHKGFQKANPTFNRQKLDWFNGEYIRRSDDEFIAQKIWEMTDKKYSQEKIDEIVPLIKERISKLSDFESFAGFFFKEISPDPELFGEDFKNHLTEAKVTLEKIDEWKKESIDKALMDLIAQKGYKTGDFFMSLRIAICGNKFTPPINDSIAILGKEETIKRLNKFI